MSTDKLLFRLEQPHGNGNLYFQWQTGSGIYLVTTGIDCIVNIFDKYGQIHDRIRLPSLCTGMSWDNDGDLLAIICQSAQLILWESNGSQKTQIDVKLKDQMSCLAWSKTTKILAIGTVKGNVSIYNHNTTKRTPIIGKHTKRIVCAAWNVDNLLALASEDKTISVSNADGDTLRIINLRGEPMDMQFAEMKLDERIGGENTISVILNQKSLYLYNLLDPENPIELSFQSHYGSIITYKWYGDGYILLGFLNGYFIAMSTHIKEVGQELLQVKNHQNYLTDIAIAETIGKAASCGDNNIKIHDLTNLQETSNIINLPQESGLEKISWNSDGQLFGVSTKNGSINIYITNINILISISIPRIAILSSLKEIYLYNYQMDKKQLKPLAIKLEIEPQFIGVGLYHLIVGMNDHLWFYDLTKFDSNDTPLLFKNQSYLARIDSIRLNGEYISILYEGKIELHTIEQIDIPNDDKIMITFPLIPTQNLQITCHHITTDFLIYATNSGSIIYFYLEEWGVAQEYKHPIGVEQIYPDPAGTRLVFIDNKSQAFIYDASLNETTPILDLTNQINGVIWDSNLLDRNIFIIYDNKTIFTYIYVKLSINDRNVKKIGATSMINEQIPILMYGGEVCLATTDGQLTHITLTTHDSIVHMNVNEHNRHHLETIFRKQIALHRYNAAFNTCLLLDSKINWLKLAEKTLKHLEINLTIRIYQILDDISMVWSLEYLKNVDDLQLLIGYINMYLRHYDVAQKWFLQSTNPMAALDMRRDLLQWNEALELAKQMAPESIAIISCEYAQQLEFIGIHSEALYHYEKALQKNLDKNYLNQCKSGIARTTLLSGNYRYGISIAIEMNDMKLLKECADILEKNQQFHDAAILYEKSKLYDKAAINWIKLKNWDKIGELLPSIQSMKIHLEYGSAKESEGKYLDALHAYERANAYDSIIRLHLDHLDNPEIAVELVEKTHSIEGGKMLANFFENLNDYTSAIKYLIISKSMDEAYQLAFKYNRMELYGDIMINTYNSDGFNLKYFHNLAKYFEEQHNYLLAGKYWFYGKNFEKSIKYLVRAAKIQTNENLAVSMAIDGVAAANDANLTNLLIDFLLGETDGLPKNPKYLFRLYMAKKQYKEASKSAIIIANEEQINGNYRNAHDVLFEMYQELKRNNHKIPQEMSYNLMLLHSYILVRLHVRRGDHMKAARMLIRVANNISQFPSHIVPILTSAVIECHRANLRLFAYKFATNLMNPEYRKNIDEKYSKKIENIVRKTSKKNLENLENPQENLTPCPYCDNLLSETEIFCNLCKNNLPFCIATGCHIIKEDLTACPECDFPAIRTPFIEILDSEECCPMCGEKIHSKYLTKNVDIKNYLNIE